MPSYKPYRPEQAGLLPVHVQDVLPENHRCFLVHAVVEKLDIAAFEAAYGEAGGESPYHPRMMLKVWLYAFALQVKSRRKLEQRLHEDLGFRFLAGGCAPDFKTLSEFLRVHRAAIVELQVLQMLRRAGLARVGEVAIDSTRIKGNASRDRVVQRKRLQKQVQQWMDAVEDDPDRRAGPAGEQRRAAAGAGAVAAAGGARHRRLCAGFEFGQRVERQAAGRRVGSRAGAAGRNAAHAAEAAQCGGAATVSKAQRVGGTQDGLLERARRDASVPTPRLAAGGRRVHPG